MTKGSSKEVISANVAELVKAGHSQAQAVAIAYSEARKNQDEEEGGKRELWNDKDDVAFCCFTDGDKILWVRRTKDNSWGFPGGHVDAGESVIEAVIRESREEIQHAPVTGISLIYQKKNVHIFASNDGEFEPVLNDEHDAYLWATIEDAPYPLFHRIEKKVGTIAEQAENSANGMDESIIIGKRLEFADKIKSALDKREWDANGWFTVPRNPLSKVGVFPYLGRSISPDLEPNKIYGVLRSAEELGSVEAMESLKLIPWVDDHVMLGAEEDGLMPVEQKGMQGMTGEQVEFDGSTLFCNIKVVSEAMKNLIEEGKEELSLGYRCQYVQEDGVFDGKPYQFKQTDIRFNHLALVERGRMGADVRVLDHDITLEEPNMAKVAGANGSTKDQLKTLLGKSSALDEALKTVIKALDADEERPDGDTARDEDAKKDDTEKKTEDMKYEEDEKEDDKDDKKESGMDAAIIAQKVEKTIREKAKIYGQLSAVVGSFDHDEMSLKEIVKYGCEKLGIKAGKGERKAALTGYLAGKGAQTQAMDAAPQGKKVDFVTAFLNNKGA